MLVDGKWTKDWQPVQATDAKGGFVRQVSGFRNWITPDGAPGPTGDGGFAAVAGRYHLYVGYICPWASRTLMVRKLKHLEGLIGVTVVEPVLTDQGWEFASDPDPLNHVRYMHEIYTLADPRYSGRATIPVLWDKERATIVSNESADIVRMLDTAFEALAPASLELYPADIADAIDDLNDWLYDGFNNGVYRAGFATTQEAYEEAFTDVFDRMDGLEARLADGRAFLHGDRLTESDIRAFVTLIRFDPAYHGQFKCNRARLVDYPHLLAYTRRVLDVPGIRETVDIDHIKRGYYSIKALNPSGIVPVGPDLSWMES